MASRGVPGSKSLIVFGSEGVSATTDRDLCACLHAGCLARETTCIYAANQTAQCINFGTVFLSAMRIGKALPYWAASGGY